MEQYARYYLIFLQYIVILQETKILLVPLEQIRLRINRYEI
jgi:hypothetical protein